MATQPVLFTSPAYDYSADLSAIERRKQMAAMLQQEGLQPVKEQPIAPGQFAVRTNPFQMAAKLAQVMAGNHVASSAEAQQKELAAKAQSDLEGTLKAAQLAATGGTRQEIDPTSPTPVSTVAVPGDLSKAANIYLRHPMTAPLGMQMAQRNLEDQNRQRMLAGLIKQDAGGATPGGPWSPQYAAQAQATSGNPLAGADPKLLSMALDTDPAVSKLGMHFLSANETQGRVFHDQNGRAYTLMKNGQPKFLSGIEQGLTPAERYKIPLEQAQTYFTTGQRPGQLPTPGQTQSQPSAATTPQPMGVPNSPIAAPNIPTPQGAPPLSTLPPKTQAEIIEAQKKYENELTTKRGFNMAGLGDALDNAEAILSGKQKPTGSVIGTLFDQTAGAFGHVPKGAIEAAQLRALGGALVSKMPRMEGPQSDRDVIMYREMAGKIGDSNVPVAERQAALQVVRQLWAKYDKNATPATAAQTRNDPWGILPK